VAAPGGPMIVALVVLALAVHRVARLLVVDSLLEPARDWWVWFSYEAVHSRDMPAELSYKELAEVAMDDPTHPKIVELAACVHCVGMWASFALTPVWCWGGTWGHRALLVLAAAGAHSAWSEMTDR
jgi:hypothetical protein